MKDYDEENMYEEEDDEVDKETVLRYIEDIEILIQKIKDELC